MNIRDYNQKYYKNLPEDQKEKREYERNNYLKSFRRWKGKKLENIDKIMTEKSSYI